MLPRQHHQRSFPTASSTATKLRFPLTGYFYKALIYCTAIKLCFVVFHLQAVNCFYAGFAALFEVKDWTIEFDIPASVQNFALNYAIAFSGQAPLLKNPE